MRPNKLSSWIYGLTLCALIIGGMDPALADELEHPKADNDTRNEYNWSLPNKKDLKPSEFPQPYKLNWTNGWTPDFELQLSSLTFDDTGSVFWTATEKGPSLVQFMTSSDGVVSQISSFDTGGEKGALHLEAIDLYENSLFAIAESGHIYEWKLDNDKGLKPELSKDIRRKVELESKYGNRRYYYSLKGNYGWEGIAVTKDNIWAVFEGAAVLERDEKYDQEMFKGFSGAVLTNLKLPNAKQSKQRNWIFDPRLIIPKCPKEDVRLCALEWDGDHLLLLASWYNGTANDHWLLAIDVKYLEQHNKLVDNVMSKLAKEHHDDEKRARIKADLCKVGMQYVDDSLQLVTLTPKGTKNMPNVLETKPYIQFIGKIPKPDGDEHKLINWEGMAIQVVGNKKYLCLISDDIEGNAVWEKEDIPPHSKNEKTFFLRIPLVEKKKR